MSFSINRRQFIKTATLTGAALGIAGPSFVAKSSDRSNTMVLTDDGSWGYAGRHAYIAREKLFYSFLDSAGGKWVATYDFRSGENDRFKVGEAVADIHGSNPLMIRPDGRIQVFIEEDGYHDNKIRWRVSTEPWSISEFGSTQESELEADIVQGRQFYPMVHQATGEVYLVLNALRDGELREAVMWKSPDGGDTWTEYHNLWGLGKGLRGNRCYTRPYIKGDEIHFVTLRVGWSEPLADQNIGRVEGVYYVKYDVKKKEFFRADGSRAFGIRDLPLYQTENFDEIWNWERDGGKKQRALWSDIVADHNGKPYVTFTVLDAVPRHQSALHDGFWATTDDNGKWHHHKVAKLARGWDNTPERKNYAIALDPHDPHTVYVSVSTSEENDLSQVQRFRTPDAGRSWEPNAVLSGEGRVTTVVVPQVVSQSARRVPVMWLEGRMEGWSDYETRIMACLS